MNDQICEMQELGISAVALYMDSKLLVRITNSETKFE